MSDQNNVDQSKYFPTFVQLSSLLRIKADILDTKRKVAIGADLLKELITCALTNVEFDPDWYLKAYPDIREAWENKQIQDLREHFISKGYFEGRLPHSRYFDEKWYLDNYSDVRQAIADGRVNSASEHYFRNGQLEWRSPNRLSGTEVEKWRKIGSQD